MPAYVNLLIRILEFLLKDFKFSNFDSSIFGLAKISKLLYFSAERVRTLPDTFILFAY